MDDLQKYDVGQKKPDQKKQTKERGYLFTQSSTTGKTNLW